MVEEIYLLFRQWFCKIYDMVAVRVLDLVFGLMSTGARYVKFVMDADHKSPYT
jgi:hypothetical protein